MEQKEVEDFLIRLGGAFTGGIEDMILECNYILNVQPNRPFPYTVLNPSVPPVDDLLVGGLAVPPWAIGYFTEQDGKKRGDSKQAEMGKTLKKFGEGDLCYSVPMLIHQTLRIATGSAYLQSRVPGSRPSGGPAPTPKNVIKL